ncbi:choline dehydrogenase [Colwellia sp. MB02u-18]|uniref:GMC family oxidoreductase n=1 Tax=unclassified Colwellia TaxID=196834 RepID=UPI0015F69990|nr:MULTISPECIES: choline dehydrogenase [unclassified Colwellia]MBA6223086.1 choline dehydrogenase [Colwellia sp. MB3u-45]MBA6267510.1 choline dehydrogenase [Colwellia sp. MB3u-43]MBA6320363.1 choline dehydrogenase [Colwellia sp. MB02u-19]MBA6323122.1 choline dehydrogenase [Colwellia sp. MB02u-18]MBA6330455.1 choline dehydrogenase [Colwellia sp. MB02u-12]
MNTQKKSANEFDYIIVGGGSAGCVLANRLTENGKFTVCLLEAGGDNKSMLVNTPGAFSAFMFLKKFNWSFNAKPKSDIRHGAALFVPRGRGLGGSSATNAMLYLRGQKQDYDHWAALGNEGWAFDDMLPYFKKSETNQRGSSEWHGDSGPLQVTDRPVFYEISKRYIEAGKQAGFKFTDDFNGSDQEGVGYYQCTIKDGKRCSAAHAYLLPILARENLTVLTDAQVSKVLIKDQQAYGVDVVIKGEKSSITAKKEVILSGGTIASPQLLMLSGIGDKNELNEQGIDCVHELKGVGKNLQEHVDACILVKSKKTDGFTVSVSGLLKMLPDTVKYIMGKKGKLANSILEAGGFLKSSEQVQRPDIQLHMLPLLYDDNGRDLKLLSQHGFSCHICVLRPESTGTVSLKSANYQDAPEIDFNFFSDQAGKDKAVMIDGMRQLRKILTAPALAEHYDNEVHPGKDFETDEQIFAKVKERLGIVYHPVGTCKMGHDDMAVVDHQLKVHGIKNLRVVDASIMPTLISGNTNAPTMAIAEKVSAMILAN